MSNSIITIIVLFMSTFSFAQEAKSINLEQAITMAKENNMDLKIADKEIEKLYKQRNNDSLVQF